VYIEILVARLIGVISISCQSLLIGILFNQQRYITALQETGICPSYKGQLSDHAIALSLAITCEKRTAKEKSTTNSPGILWEDVLL
jgi:hypothetical protein